MVRYSLFLVTSPGGGLALEGGVLSCDKQGSEICFYLYLYVNININININRLRRRGR